MEGIEGYGQNVAFLKSSKQLQPKGDSDRSISSQRLKVKRRVDDEPNSLNAGEIRRWNRPVLCVGKEDETLIVQENTSVWDTKPRGI